MRLWVIAILTTMSIVVSPSAGAKDGCGGNGGKDRGVTAQRLSQQDEVSAAAAALVARDFYVGVVHGLDTAIRNARRELAASVRAIASIDHKLAADFAADFADDTTADEMMESANEALAPIEKHPPVEFVVKHLPVDRVAVEVAISLYDLKSEISDLQSLESARADMVRAARANGATIN